jgi:hypothetical protein
MLVAIMATGSRGQKNDKASHYGTHGVVVVSPKALLPPFSRPEALTRSVLTIGCSSASALAGYSPLALRLAGRHRSVKSPFRATRNLANSDA